MREYFNITQSNEEIVKQQLDTLLLHEDHLSYRNAFHNLGVQLGLVLNSLTESVTDLAIACTSEDCDWLAKGLYDTISHDASLFVFWSNRRDFGVDVDGRKLEYSEIQKEFKHLEGQPRNLIIIKSIISSSCVIKSQILRLCQQYDFEKIFIAAPVMYKEASCNLQREFPSHISSKFHYICFAVDDELDQNGWVSPGIGGSVYELLDVDSRHYTPELVKSFF